MLRQLLHNLGSNIPIAASVIFINPEFNLYNAPQGKPLIFPTQLNNYFKKLNSTPSYLNEKHKMLADKLISLHIEDIHFRQLPHYDFDLLNKGITCAECDSFSISVKGKKCVCKDCVHEEMIAAAVMRSVDEFKLLFPNQKVTTNAIYEWCKVVTSKKRIQRILEKNFKIAGINRWSYYQ